MLFRSNSMVFGFLENEEEFYGEIPMRPTGREVGWVEIEDIPDGATFGLGRMWSGSRASDFEDEVGFPVDREDPDEAFAARVAREDGFGSEFSDHWSDRVFALVYGFDRDGTTTPEDLLMDLLLSGAEEERVRTVSRRLERRVAGETHHQKPNRFRRIPLISAAA